MEDTRVALRNREPAIFEAAFIENGVFVAVDILERLKRGHRLIEVKSSSSVKDYHIPDLAVQTHVLRNAGLKIREIALMHLNRDYRHPGNGELFVIEDVTEQVEAMLPDVPAMITDQVASLSEAEPDVPIGVHCTKGWGCPFETRCWSQAPDHVTRLYRVGMRKALKLMSDGVECFDDVSDDTPIGALAHKQLDAWKKGCVIVEPGLRNALKPFLGKVGFLDFETVAMAIPVWDGLAPWGQVPVQFSYHESGRGGSHRHVEWLAEGPADPRPALAQALVNATHRVKNVATYSSFESRCIRHLMEAVPELADELGDLDDRLVDLLPIVRSYIAHPDFGGSFSIKAVLEPLVGGYEIRQSGSIRWHDGKCRVGPTYTQK